MLKKIKRILLNKLLSGVTIDELIVNRIKTTGQNTAYLDLIKLDPRTSNPSLSEGLLWFRSDLDNIYLSPDGSQALQILKDGDPVQLEDGDYPGALVGISSNATGRAAYLDNLNNTNLRNIPDLSGLTPTRISYLDLLPYSPIKTGIIYDYPMVNEQPPFVSTYTTGNGSVAFEASGAKIYGGYSTGDDASITSINTSNLIKSKSDGRLIIEALVSFASGDYPPTDDTAIGIILYNNAEATFDRLAYFDPTDGNVRVGSNTASVTFPSMNAIARWLRIEVDFDNTKTYFYADNNLLTSISAVPTEGGEVGAVITSNGAGDIMRLIHLRYGIFT